ncbi:FAD/FMN-containing dehydrogenase [Haloactinopolyspora alba]|uniref:FAD/FMN-containing dehydrogenase n=1 Tax=Haloactinopolyspora alba TaxID=648780 RepID=A0A2P8E7A1_9ACTN|nr:FAD-binding oxidoreductase [Haloactinopolyspora alba]PSL05352.1 FAD/FMN-containing dehydrogenase [Haloactinopolyspora alba]
MTQTMMTRPEAAARSLRRTGAAIHLPGGAGYDQHRSALAPTLDPRPAVVVEAASTADVHAAVVAAREHDLPFAVQATGHGTHVPCDDGLLLKTTAMAAVQVDPYRQVARVGPGARWGEVLAAAAPYGLAPLSGSSATVGVTGYTLGGGVGWLGRKFGFAADSVLSAEIVTADGRLVHADTHEHPDLFWAIRGGGGGFGVVTSLEFRLYPVARVYGGVSYFAVDRAGEVLARYRDWACDAPDELSTAVVLTRAPERADIPAELHGRRVLGIKAMYTGDADDAERLLRPLRDVAGPAVVDGYRTMRFADAAMGGTPARYLDFFDRLPDAVTECLVDVAARPGGNGPTVEIRHWGGAMGRPGPDAGPVGNRTSPFSVIVDAPDPALVGTLRPHGTGSTFLNFLADTSRTAQAYTRADYARLRDIKLAHDPGNVFGIGHVVR